MRSESVRRRAGILGIALGVIVLAGCSMTPDKDSPTVAYREAESTRSLEVPPDLTQSTSDQALDVPGEGKGAGSALLPEFDGIHFRRAGATEWLEIDGLKPEDLWPRIDGFLQSQGLTVQKREPALGIVETNWAKRYDSPPSGGLSGLLSGLFSGIGSKTIMDQYQIRLERMDNDAGTRVFVSQRSATEVNTNPNQQQAGDYAWSPGSGDPAIEAEMTRRLLVYLGVGEQRARGIISRAQASQAIGVRVEYHVSDAGAAWIQVDDRDRGRVFAQVGDALPEIGAKVRNVDRYNGVYAIDWLPPDDVIEKDPDLQDAFGSKGDRQPIQLEVHLKASGDKLQIFAADAQGTRRSGPVHKALLRQLAGALGGNPGQVNRAQQNESDGGSSSDAPMGKRGPL